MDIKSYFSKYWLVYGPLGVTYKINPAWADIRETVVFPAFQNSVTPQAKPPQFICISVREIYEIVHV